MLAEKRETSQLLFLRSWLGVCGDVLAGKLNREGLSRFGDGGMLTKIFIVAQSRFQFCTSLQEHLVMQTASASLLVKRLLRFFFRTKSCVN